MIKTILWDVDGTLLDFGAAERAAMTALYREFGLGTCTEDALRRYSQLNKTYWERLERREITKPELLVRRFQDFFGAFPWTPQPSTPPTRPGWGRPPSPGTTAWHW